MKKHAFAIVALLLFGFSNITSSLSLASPTIIQSSALIDYTQTDPQPVGRLHVDGNVFKNATGGVIKFRGTNFAPDVSYFGGHGTQQQVNYVADWGFNNIRLVVDIGQWRNNAPSWENYAQNIVDWASARRVYVIILGYWYGEGNGAIDTNGWTWQWDTVRSFWHAFANKFKNEDYVLYDLMNEPAFNSTDTGVDFYQELVNIVRQYSNQICIVEAISVNGWYNPGLVPFVSNPITGGNIAYSSHHFWWPQFGTPSSATKGRLDSVGATDLVEAGYAYWLGEVNYDASRDPYGGDWMRDMLSHIETGYGSYEYAGWTHWGWMTEARHPAWFELADWDGNPSHQGEILQDYL